ncbi:MAG: hypothetical protein N2C12_13070, partial [Planctomycetales bacterium]
GGAGGQAGPDLSSLGGSSQIPYLFESILDPSAKLKDQYQTVVVETTDGRILTGIVTEDGPSQMRLRDGKDVLRTISRNDIEHTQPSPVSLMPAELTQSLRRDELIDLVRFLSELGREGAYRIPTEQFVRTWQVLQPSEQLTRQLAQAPAASLLVADQDQFDWQSVYSTVAGNLPLADLPRIGSLSVARFAIETANPGKVRFRLNDTTGLWVSVDKQTISADDLSDRQATVTLDKGTHTVTILVDRATRFKPLRIMLADVEDGATVQLIGGK